MPRSPMNRYRAIALTVLLGIGSVPAGCASNAISGSNASNGEGAPSSMSASSMPTTATISTTTSAPGTTAPTVPPPLDDYGMCRVMGPSSTGWEIVLDLESAIGHGTYLVDYALRDDAGTILETVTREIYMDADEVLSYWDSLRSKATGVTSCDIRRIEKDQEVCVVGRGCTLLA